MEYRLAFSGGVNIQTASNLRSRICQVLERPDFGSLVVMFASEGGSTDQSLALFNFLLQLPVPVRMHAVGHVGSAAIPVFLAGSTRTASPLSRFFFHEYDWGFDARKTLRQIDEAKKRLRSDIELSRQIINSRARVPTRILEALDGGTPAVVPVEQAKAFGLISEICDLDESGPNGDGVAVWAA